MRESSRVRCRRVRRVARRDGHRLRRENVNLSHARHSGSKLLVESVAASFRRGFRRVSATSASRSPRRGDETPEGSGRALRRGGPERLRDPARGVRARRVRPLEDLAKEKRAERVVVYDPYFCAGAASERLHARSSSRARPTRTSTSTRLGDTESRVDDGSTNMIYRADVLVTNLPFSGDHCRRLVEFLAGGLRSVRCSRRVRAPQGLVRAARAQVQRHALHRAADQVRVRRAARGDRRTRAHRCGRRQEQAVSGDDVSLGAAGIRR